MKFYRISQIAPNPKKPIGPFGAFMDSLDKSLSPHSNLLDPSLPYFVPDNRQKPLEPLKNTKRNLSKEEIDNILHELTPEEIVKRMKDRNRVKQNIIDEIETNLLSKHKNLESLTKDELMGIAENYKLKDKLAFKKQWIVVHSSVE